MNGATSSFSAIPPSRRLIAAIVLALSNFMVVLDMTIANVSIPHISGDLGIATSQGTWVITSYAVAEAICVPLTGWLAQRFGAVKVFMFSMSGFGIFSLLCGLSPTLGMLVICRVGQGFCGGPLMPMSQTLLMSLYPPAQRGKAMGIWAMTTLLGPALGPILGGTISDNLSWHWIFFINVPIAVIISLAAIALLRPLETKAEKTPIDVIGLVLLVFWIGCLQIMLDIGREHDWFSDPFVLTLGICALLGFVVFLVWELTDRHPVVNLRVFANRGFSMGVLALALCFGTYFASIVIIPQWLQLWMGYTATQAGLVTAFTAMSALITSQIAARLIGKVDPRIMVSCAMVWLGLMSLWRAMHWTGDADFWSLALPQLFQGFAMPFFIVPLTTITLGAVKPWEVPSAAGLQNFLRTMASAIASSIVLTLWDDAQRVSRSEIVGSLQPDDTLRQLANDGFSSVQSWGVISNLADAQATAMAVNHVFLLSTGAMFFAAVLIWLSPRPKAPVDQSAAH